MAVTAVNLVMQRSPAPPDKGTPRRATKSRRSRAKTRKSAEMREKAEAAERVREEEQRRVERSAQLAEEAVALSELSTVEVMLDQAVSAYMRQRWCTRITYGMIDSAIAFSRRRARKKARELALSNFELHERDTNGVSDIAEASLDSTAVRSFKLCEELSPRAKRKADLLRMRSLDEEREILHLLSVCSGKMLQMPAADAAAEGWVAPEEEVGTSVMLRLVPSEEPPADGACV